MRWIPIIALGLAGCSTLGPSISESAAALKAYNGKNVQAVIDRIGYPDRQEPILDKTAYYWGEDHEDGPVCQWKVVADAAGVIVDGGVYGNIDGCERETRKLQGR